MEEREGCVWVDVNKVSFMKKEKKGGGGIVCMPYFDRLGQAELYNFMNFKKNFASPHTKKMREEKLVRGFSPTDVEAKVTKVYENYSQDWRITAIVESKIDEVIEN